VIIIVYFLRRSLTPAIGILAQGPPSPRAPDSWGLYISSPYKLSHIRGYILRPIFCLIFTVFLHVCKWPKLGCARISINFRSCYTFIESVRNTKCVEVFVYFSNEILVFKSYCYSCSIRHCSIYIYIYELDYFPI
jgi:hypothetical protein